MAFYLLYVKGYLPYNFIREFKSFKEASEVTKSSGGNICNCCQGKRNKAAGHIWRYKTEHAYDEMVKFRPWEFYSG